MKGHCSFHFTIFKTLRTTRQNKLKSYGRVIPYLFNIGKGKQGQKYLVEFAVVKTTKQKRAHKYKARKEKNRPY
jgi:hypothetical protein